MSDAKIMIFPNPLRKDKLAAKIKRAKKRSLKEFIKSLDEDTPALISHWKEEMAIRTVPAREDDNILIPRVYD